MSTSENLHRHLAAWRSIKGLSQEQVANILGVNKSTVSRWEKGERAVDLSDLERLAAIYGVSPVALFLSPGDTEAAKNLTLAMDILKALPTDVGRRWLATGVDIAGDKLPNRQNPA